MKEKYLHYLWKNKLIPLQKLSLQNGKSFRVLYPGDYNQNDSGPDFLNARIEIDSILFIGNVEIHVKSKDWYLHRHHLDAAYNTVVLHVVLEDNGNVMIDNVILPTLSLKDHIDWKHYMKYQSMFRLQHEILCATQLKDIPKVYIVSMQQKMLVNRLERKIADVSVLPDHSDDSQVLFHFLAKAMGSKINQLPFDELSTRIELKQLKKFPASDQIDLIKITSGLFYENDPSKLIKEARYFSRNKTICEPMRRESWKFGGTRPGNSPLLRVEQFAILVSQCDFSTDFTMLSSEKLVHYFMSILSLSEKELLKNDKTLKLSKAFKEHLIINCFVPFLYWYGSKHENVDLIEKAFEVLKLMKPEKNSILDKWLDHGIVPSNASESQSLIELYNSFCSNKKCLLCDVGNKILNQA